MTQTEAAELIRRAAETVKHAATIHHSHIYFNQLDPEQYATIMEIDRLGPELEAAALQMETDAEANRMAREAEQDLSDLDAEIRHTQEEVMRWHGRQGQYEAMHKQAAEHLAYLQGLRQRHPQAMQSDLTV